MLYQAYQNHADWMVPWRELARHTVAAPWLRQSALAWPLRDWLAALELSAHLQLTHQRPAWGIDSVSVSDQAFAVAEEKALELPFGTLLHLRKDGAPAQPAVLLAAPLSGHFSTLLRDTARTLLQHHDVYVTDWHNARDVPLSAGPFGLDDYVEHLMAFIEHIGPGTHVVAVCQPCVAALAAAALMAEDDHPAQPRSLTLMAGPVDCRVNPTAVNTMATSKPIGWFKDHLINRVPRPHKGAGRRVYPGFVQLSAFMSMNPDRHKKAFRDLYRHLLSGDVAQAATITAFYGEYFAVNDLPAEFFLETVEKIFQTYDLPRGQLSWRGRTVNPAAIRRTWLFTVEGERDDICAIGQTVAAQELCSGLRPYMKTHHVQVGVGHYGVFSGSKWNRQIYPRLRDVIHAAEELAPAAAPKPRRSVAAT